MSAELELSAVAARLSAGGQRVSTEHLRGGPALVGLRSDFRLRWMATNLNLLTVAVAVPTATGPALDAFAEDALTFAIASRGGARGFQSGVGVIALMVADTVAPDAVQVATERIVKKFAAFAWPAVIDVSTGALIRHQGSVLVGGLYASWMRHQIAVAAGRLAVEFA